jgi:hypothetical protein
MTINEYIIEHGLKYGDSIHPDIWSMLGFETSKTVKAYELVAGEMMHSGWLYYNGSTIIHLSK